MCRVKLRLLIGYLLTLIIEYDYGVGTNNNIFKLSAGAARGGLELQI